LRLWSARILIGLVIAWNLQAALVFLLSPGVFAPGFELSGPPGEAAIRGIAILFIMWNVPYLVAAWHPRKHLLSLKEALVMQFIGLLGETVIFLNLPPAHNLLQSSILRFIIFDASGLAALVVSFWLANIKNIQETST
jgi:hypothetical protein